MTLENAAPELERPIAHLWIPGQLPGLNEIIDAAATRRGQWNGYMSLKSKWEHTIANHAHFQKFPKIEQGHFTYLIQEPNRRRDPSNVVAGVVKFVEDALQNIDLLGNDGWKQVLSIRPYFLAVDGGAALAAGTSLFVTQDEPLTFEEAVFHHDQGRARARLGLRK